MHGRYQIVSIAALALLMSGCLLRPIDPTGSSRRASEPEPQTAETPPPAVTEEPPPVTAAAQPAAVVPPPVTVVPPTAAAAAPAAATPSTAWPTPSAAPPVRSSGIGRTADGNIAAMLLASNNTDISYARLVPTRAQRADVRKFAERMLTDHNGVNGLVTDLLRKLDLAPVDNEASLDLRDESANKRDIMRELSGFSFDSAYIQNEVSYHQKFLALLDEVMIPRARNSDLRSLLVVVRPAVAAHLAHAEQVRAEVLAKK